MENSNYVIGLLPYKVSRGGLVFCEFWLASVFGLSKTMSVTTKQFEQGVEEFRVGYCALFYSPVQLFLWCSCWGVFFIRPALVPVCNIVTEPCCLVFYRSSLIEGR